MYIDVLYVYNIDIVGPPPLLSPPPLPKWKILYEFQYGIPIKNVWSWVSHFM